MNFNPFHIDRNILDEETIRLKRISGGKSGLGSLCGQWHQFSGFDFK
ncbi:MAG: hypothetical protein GY899_13115 [Verrucomicrobiaceae bacterium]|nr:hypothetical protein [Verrucomicrobiaceae bacterium]